jgi:hypothetical protein
MRLGLLPLKKHSPDQNGTIERWRQRLSVLADSLSGLLLTIDYLGLTGNIQIFADEFPNEGIVPIVSDLTQQFTFLPRLG